MLSFDVLGRAIYAIKQGMATKEERLAFEDSVKI